MGESSTTRTPLVVTNKTWLISDTHFGHKNIIKFQQRPESHEIIMLSEWIKAVGEDDDILHLGDVFMGKQGSPDRWAAVVARLPGRKFLILGNHDKGARHLYENAGFTIIKPFIHQGVAFTHRPITKNFPLWAPEGKPQGEARKAYLMGDLYLGADKGWHTNIHGHIHGNVLRQNPNDEDDVFIFKDKTYINVSVEVTDYKPVPLGNVHPLKRSPKRGS